MHLVYLSTDELNQSLARAWGKRQGIEVGCPKPECRELDRNPDGLLLDLDHRTSHWIEALAKWVERDDLRTCPVVVHGYSTAVHPFRCVFRGMHKAVYSRICSELLREFARNPTVTAPGRSEDESDTLTWVNLV